jgi:O-antigen/teichoic acid export membrane protein
MSRRGIKGLLSDSLIYGLTGIVSRFIGIFLIPIYTKVFAPEDYGLLGLIGNSFAFISIFLVLAMDSSTARWFYDTEEKEDRRSSINTWLWFYLTLSVAAAILLFLFAPYINSILLKEVKNGILYLRLMAITLPLGVLSSVASNVLRFERKPVNAVVLSLSSTLLTIGLNIYFVLYLHLGLLGVYYALVITGIYGSIVAIFLVKKWIKKPVPYDFNRLKKMLHYSWPFVPATLAIWVVNSSGVFFINGFMSKADVGIYQIGALLASVMGLITAAFQQAWGPFAFSILKDPDAKSVYARVFDFYIMLFTSGAVFIALFGREMLMLFTQPEYYIAYDVATIMAYSYLFVGLINIADLGLSITKKTKPLGFIMTISAGLIVLLNITLIPLWGRIGAALALCISQAINPVYMFYRSQKVYPIPFKFAKGIQTIIAGIIVSVLAILLLNNHNLILGILLKSVILLIFVFFVAYIYRSSFQVLINKFRKKN